MDKSTKKRATITQVAKHAGVSVGTVSNYLNGTAGVSHDRAARIQQAIDVLDYIPDTLASSLRRKDSTAIHVLTPHLDSAFYTNTISALMHDAYEAGYTVHISGYEYSSEIERQQLRALESSKPGTSIIIFNGFDDLTEIKRLAKKQIHVIMADRREIPGYTSSVIFDNRRVPFEIICLLKNRNYKRIGLFTEPTKLQNIRGKNFAAGMSGGVAYVLDENNDLYTKVNKQMVSVEKLGNKYDVQELKDMIAEHTAYTNSAKGKEILNHFEEYLPKFKKIIPHDYNRMMMAIVQMEEKGLSSEQAQIEAFYANKAR